MRIAATTLIFGAFLVRVGLSQPVAYIDNGYIQVGATASNGMFCIGSPYGPIMYGDPRSGGNSSHTVFKIDDNFYSNDPFIEPPGIPIMIEEPARVSGGSIIGSWVINGITITQLLQPVIVVSGGETTGTVNIQYTFINRDTIPHSVGILTTIDLYVGGRDDAPISVPGYPFSDTACAFAGGNIPYFFRAYSRGPEYPDSVQLVAQCNLFDPSVPMPEYIVFGDNRDILSTVWNYTPPPSHRYDDAGVLIRWSPVLLQPDSIFTIRYSLGIAPTTVAIVGALSLRFEAPSRLGFFNCNMIPNPFLITVRATNTTITTAESVNATIYLPEGLELANGSPTIPIRPNPNIPSGLTGYATWSVRANPPTSGDVFLRYRIVVTSATVDSNFGVDSILVPFSTYRGPLAEPRLPFNNSFTSNLNQLVKIYLRDDDTRVDTTKISFKLAIGARDTFVYRYARDTLYYEPGESILVFSRPTPYRSGDVVTAILDKAPDIHGCQIDSALRIRFTVDAEGPRVRGFFPEDTIITNPQTMIKINLEDDISGVRLSSINLTLNDLVYPFDNRILTYGYDTTVYGYCLNLNPLELFGPSGFPDGTYRLCLNDVTDSIDLGEPNHLVGAPWCWRFIVNSHGPIANLISPPNGVITSCAEQPIRFTISDGNGLNLSTLRIVVNGRNYDITSLRAINDTTYEFAQPWTNGLTVNFNLTTCEDSLRTPIHNPISCNFTVDLSPPVVLNPTPTPNDTVGEPFPVVSANVADSIAGLRFSSLRFVVGRDTISYGNPAITFVPPSTFRLNLESIGYPRPVGFDTVRVCILVEDTAQICSPNATTFCWSFFRNLTGPIGYPLIDSLLCTMHSQLRFFLHNSEGVLFSSVVLRIEYPADTVIYRGTVDSELSYTVDTLIFTPSRGWLDGARYRACITEAEDLYGTPISSPICASFRVDISPPYVVAYSPSTIDINDTLQPITIVLGDTARSIEPLSIKFIILRDTLRITSPGLILRNDTLRFDPALAGISYPQRETLAVLLEVSDRCGHTLHWQHQWYETKVDEQSNIIPTELSILRVHPNPFNASVNITIGVPSETNIVIEILDIMGRRVKPLYNGLIKPPFATFIWDGTEKNGNEVSSGIYFVRISDGKIIKHKSIIFLK